MKACVKCGVVQPLESFYKAPGTRDGHRGDCKDCFRARAKARYPSVREANIARARKWREDNLERYQANQRRMRGTPEGKMRQRAGHLMRKFGMTIEQYEAMLEAQGGGCFICGRPPRDDISLHWITITPPARSEAFCAFAATTPWLIFRTTRRFSERRPRT